MRSIKRYMLVLVVLISCVGCDQVTKTLAKTLLADSHGLTFGGHVLHFQLAYNPGAFLGLAGALPEVWRSGLLSLGVGLLLLGLLGYLWRAPTLTLLETSAFALMLAGGLSNLLDRLRYAGWVVDFIYLDFGIIHTGIFNIADIAIMVGVLLLGYTALRNAKVPQ